MQRRSPTTPVAGVEASGIKPPPFSTSPETNLSLQTFRSSITFKMKYSQEDFQREQKAGMPPVAKADLTGKTVIITGANVGIGFEATKHLANMNPGKLVLVCRNATKGEEAAAVIKKETNFDRVEAWTMDQGDFSSISAFASRVEKDLDRVDILVANAGVADPKYSTTGDGWEQHLQVNHLGPTLLALLLLPKMMETAKKHNTIPRFVSVASDNHHWIDIEKQVIEAPNSMELASSKEYCSPSVMAGRYPASKLINLLAMRALDSRLPQTPPPVLFVTVSPGFCHSSLRRNLEPGPLLERMEKMLAIAFTTEEGSRQLVFGAVADEEENKLRASKAFIMKSKLQEPSDWVLSEDGKRAEEKIWNDTVEILGKVDNRVQKVVSEYLSA
ncbi:hypothetical protein D9758_011883 [Tetrapyrgos nigripes]|uniref:Uncharacterized protein n=1 Tax=Tetrapyrgos nigripes TaxID=182062 RepID=A0A8H5FQU8_9AGAR|nr:hypothetical protein D9758_011883 [Tetrapyrgos nigripes]